MPAGKFSKQEAAYALRGIQESLQRQEAGFTADWQGCCRASNRLADLVCLMYHPKDAKARQTWPTATWAEIIASELGIAIPEQD